MSKLPASPQTIAWFRQFAGAYPQVTLKSMFGQVAAFISDNSQMAAGTFGPDVILRLGPTDRADFIAQYQAEPFEPMPGRPMKEYLLAPPAVRNDEALLRAWFERALEYADSLPAKKRKA